MQGTSGMTQIKILGGSVIFIFNLSLALFITSKLVYLQNSLQKERQAVEVASTSAKIASLTHRLGSDCVIAASPRLRRTVGHEGRIPETKQALDAELKILSALSLGDEKAKAILQEQEHLYETVLSKFKQDMDFFAHRDFMREKGIPYESLAFNGSVTAQYSRLLDDYKKSQLEAPEVIKRALSNLKMSLVIGFALNLLVGTLAIGFTFQRISRRLDRLSDNVSKFLDGKDLGGADGDSDEIGRLDALLRGMTSSVRESEAQKKLLLSGAPEVVCAIDKDENFVLVNQACLTQWGIVADDLIGRSWLPLAGASAQEKILGQLNSLRKAKRSAEAQAFEVDLNIGDKTIETRWSCYFSSLDELIYCFISDIGKSRRLARELQAREESIRVLVENLPLGLIVLDEVGTVKSANEKFSELMNLSPADLVGRNAEGFFDFGGLARTESHFRESGKKRARLRNTKGSRDLSVWCEVVVVPIEEGEKERLVLVSDLREKIRLENIRRDFVSLLRQNLREPLDKLLSIVQSLDYKEEEKQQSRVTRVSQNTARVLRLIDDLLSLETLGQGKLIEKMMPVNCREVAGDAIGALEDHAIKQETTLSFVCQSSEEFFTRGDRDRLTQVLVNLISNAIKFSGKGKVVLVELSLLPDGKTIEIAVVDRGRGVPPEKRQEIFMPYMQSENKDNRIGTGLGLAICRAIAEAHGGNVGMRPNADMRLNADELGSCFYMHLPRLATIEVDYV